MKPAVIGGTVFAVIRVQRRKASSETIDNFTGVPHAAVKRHHDG
ncbi:MAG: hypothetical protein AB1426_07830 [Bacillota bacterium]